MRRSRKLIVVIVIAVLAASLSLYLFNSYVAGGGYPPFCAGYPTGGNCHANYSYTFTIILNYTGSWVLNYYGFHNGEYAGVNSSSYYMSSDSALTGQGLYAQSVTLSGDDYYFLTLCAWAQKLDNSTQTLTLAVIGSNSTSLPLGSRYYCGSVAP